jgi:hypothetical protein
MGRRRIYNERRIATAVRLPESVHERLRGVADDREVSANLIITRAITEYLERLPSVDVALKVKGSRPKPQGSS